MSGMDILTSRGVISNMRCRAVPVFEHQARHEHEAAIVPMRACSAYVQRVEVEPSRARWQPAAPLSFMWAAS